MSLFNTTARNMAIAAAFGGALALSAAPAAAADVGVSVQISQPGVYGRIDIGRFPQPQVVLSQPVIIAPPPMPQPGVVVVQPAPPPQPVYMWVPPGHRKNWRKHCGKYNACGVPVYFVRDEWYGQHVHPRGPGHDGYERRDDRRDDWRDDRHDNGRGKGHGKGHGGRD